MNLDKLIKAAQNSTPEIIEEINRRMYEILCPEECYHSYEFIEDQEYGDGCWPGDRTYSHTMAVHKCTRCGDKFDKLVHGSGGGHNKRYIELPDYTEPEKFWPLLWEIWPKCKVERFWDFDGEAVDDLLIASRHFEIIKPPGIAVCLAYLKIKGNEALVNELDLPDAEDVLKMRGKIKEQEND
jgi:hypothetical protein